MKKLIVLSSLVLLLACKKETENTEPSILDAVEGMSKIKDMGDAVKDFEKRTEELKKMKPVTSEVFKSVLQEEVNGLKRYGFSSGATSMVGTASGTAEYGDANAKNIEVVIMDGAGESGSAILAVMQMSLSISVENIQNTKTEKSEEIQGYKCITTNDTDENNLYASIMFIHDERFHITLTGTKMNLDEVKSFMKSLDLSQLK